MVLTSRITLAITADHTATAPTLDLGTGTASAVHLDQGIDTAYANGTGAGQADRLYSARRTLAASATENLDLAGVLTDAFGATITFARIKELYIHASDINSNNVVVGAASSNQWAALLNTTGTITLRPDSYIQAACGPADATGWVTTPSTGDLLKVANSGGGTSVTYDIVLIGCSA